MPSQKLGRKRTIRVRRVLERTLTAGKVVRTPYFRMHYLEGEGPPGVAFLAGRRVGGAAKRNRARRVLREALRRSNADLTGIETLILLATRQTVTAPWSDIRDAVWTELRRISDSAGKSGRHGPDAAAPIVHP